MKRRREFLFPCVRHYFPEPMVMQRGEGNYLFDSEGRRYLDFFCGILVTSLGHCHPEVVGAVVDQVRTLQHCSSVYDTVPMLELAEELARVTPGGLRKCFFTNSGSEAAEFAIQVAREYTGNFEVVALHHAYHGRTLLAMGLAGLKGWRGGRSAGATVPGVVHVPAPYCYRCPFGASYPSCRLLCVGFVEQTILTETCGQIAAFVAEPIMGVGGVIVPPAEYFREVADIVRAAGGVLVVDEVQTGFGRTGRMFAIEHWGIEPDVMVMGKALGNGVPIGVTMARPEIADAFGHASISTFGGNPVSCRAGLAVLRVIQREGLVQRAASMGDRLGRALKERLGGLPCVGEVRGQGLMWGVEVVSEGGAPSPELADRVVTAARDGGLLIGRSGLYGNVLRVAPPLTVGESEIEQAVAVLAEACRRSTAAA